MAALLLCLLPAVVLSVEPTINPTIKPRIDVEQDGTVTVFVHDEPGVVAVTIEVDILKSIRSHLADYNRDTHEWFSRFHEFNMKDVNQIDLLVTYSFSENSKIEKLYRDTFHINQETGLQPQPHQMTRRATTVLFDDFSHGKLDHNKWYNEITASGGGNGEFEAYTPEETNTFIKNGILHIKPTFTADRFGANFLQNGKLDIKSQWGGCTASYNNGCYKTHPNIPPIMSSKVISKVTIKHGRVEVLAKIPIGDWLWPAIWLNGKGKYGGWPQSGEIDIMESRGNRNLKDGHGHEQSVRKILSTIHYGSGHGAGHRQHGSSKLSANGKTWADDYHLYAVDWNQDHIRIEVDGSPVLDWKTPSQGYWKYEHFSGNNIWSSGGHDAPFDGDFKLMLNVAVGATDGYFRDDWNNGAAGKPWKNNSPTAMLDFWNNRIKWQNTWHGDDVAMKVKYVKMIQH